MKTNNELIAEFMGAIEITHAALPSIWRMYAEDGNNIIWQHEIKWLKYNTSWDWLMPVVEKIESLGYKTSFKTRYVRINPKEGIYYEYIVKVRFNEDGWTMEQNLDDGPYSLESVFGGKDILSKRDAIYKAVVEFVKWYNQNKNYEN